MHLAGVFPFSLRQENKDKKRLVDLNFSKEYYQRNLYYYKRYYERICNVLIVTTLSNPNEIPYQDII